MALYQAESSRFGKSHEISPVFTSLSELEEWISVYKTKIPNKIEELTKQREKVLRETKEFNDREINNIKNGILSSTTAYMEQSNKRHEEQKNLYDEIEILKGEVQIRTYMSKKDMDRIKTDRDVRKMTWEIFGVNTPIFK